MWPFKRKKESDGPIPYDSTPTPSTPPKPAAPPKLPSESRNWAVVVLDKQAGSGSGANLDEVLMADLQMERDEIGRFYQSATPFVAVQRVTQKFAENAVRRLALAGVKAKAETMSAAQTPVEQKPEPNTTPIRQADGMHHLPGILKAGIANANNPAFNGLEQGNYNLVLVDAGSKKIEVIKVIRAETQLGLQEAKNLVESTPSTIIAGITAEDAEMVAYQFQKVGATVQIVEGPSQTAAPTITPNMLQGTWSVVLVNAGPRKINVIKTIREVTNLGLAEAKNMTESTPCIVLAGLGQAYAQQIAQQFQDDGATAQITQGAQPVTVSAAPSSLPAIKNVSTGGWNVVLVDCGSNKIMVIKAIREHLKLGLAEAKDLADQSPSLLVNQISEASAHAFARDLQAAGATVQVSPS